MRIWKKNFLFTTSIIFLVTTISLGVLYFTMPKIYQQKKEQEATDRIDLLSEKINGKPLGEIQQEIMEEIRISQKFFYLLDEKEKIVFPDKVQTVLDVNGIAEDFDGGMFDSSVNEVVMENPDFSKYKKVVHDNAGNKYYVLLELYLQPVDEASAVLLEAYPFILVVALLIGGIAAFIYSSFSTKRIRQISAVTNQMLTLEKGFQCEVVGKDEISELASDINQLDNKLVNTIEMLKSEIEKVAEIEKSKTEFMRIASHELKTPVTAMKGILNGMILNVGRFKDRDKYLSVCNDILEKQSTLIHDILLASRVDTISANLTETISFKDCLIDTYKLCSNMSALKGYEVIFDLEDVNVVAVKSDIIKLVSNILVNVFSYTKQGGKIKITLLSHEFSVMNECEPIEKEHLDKIFEPFYRPDYARNRKDGGTGLGLYIVRQILEKNHWDYSFVSTEDCSGMIFKVHFNNQKTS